MEPGLPTASVVRSSQATPARRRGQPCIAANHPQPIHLSHPRLVFKRAEPPLWIIQVVGFPEVQQVQADGRIRRWARIPDAQDRWLRVVLLPDGETIHNAFFDRRFTP
jgi:hypothetical protein